MIQIVLADDHQVVREGFRQILDAEPDFAVVGEAGDGSTAVELVQHLQPTVLILDMVMPGLKGLEVLAQVGACSPHTRVIVLSMYDDQGYVLQALRSGAAAYILKQSSAKELIQAVRTVVSGRHYLSPPLLECIITGYLQLAQGASKDHPEALSRREQQVLRHVALGETSTQIATALAIHRQTVGTYRVRLMRKLCRHTPAELIQFAQHHADLDGDP